MFPCTDPRDAACDGVAPKQAPRCCVMGSAAVAAVFASAELLDAIFLSYFTRREAAQVRSGVLVASTRCSLRLERVLGVPEDSGHRLHMCHEASQLR